MKLPQVSRNTIRQAMGRRFWTQADLARVASISEASVHRALAGYKVHPHTVRDIIAALGLDHENVKVSV